tara:strand:+ start:1116 stop:1265 length:150 start_codon:yes stop_codon:yes gene_type:complete
MVAVPHDDINKADSVSKTGGERKRQQDCFGQKFYHLVKNHGQTGFGRHY